MRLSFLIFEVIQLRTTLRTLRTTDPDYIQTAEEIERGVEMDEAEKILVKKKAIFDLETMMQNLANGTFNNSKLKICYM